MSTRTLKLLTASTAFVAAASAGHAAVVSTNTNTGLTNTDATNYVSGTAILSSTTPAITVSGTGVGNLGSAEVGTSASAIIRSSDAGAAILLGTNAAISGTLTINNSGTITNIGGGHAIDTNHAQQGGQPAVVIRNTGTISGTINNGTGDLTYSATNGIQNGGITTTGTGIDTITLTGSTLNGDISVGNGVNNLTVSNSTLNGNYTGGSAADTTVLTNATVVGALNGGTTGGDGDVLTINGSRAFTTGGGISNYETVNIDTDVNLNHGLSAANAVNVGAGKTLTVNQTFATSSNGVITNNGTIDIASGRTVTAETFNAAVGSGLRVGIASSTEAGKLRISTGGTMQNTSVTVNLGANSGYIASGTSFVLVENVAGNATLGNVGVLNSNTGVYRFSTSVNQGSVSLTVGRVATDAVVTGSDAKGIAKALDTVSSSAVGALKTVQSNIGQAATAGDVQRIVDSLTPSIDGAGMASVNVTVDTGNQISNRLASLRGTTGVATGDAMASSHMWIQGFGSSVDQDNDGGNFGYDASSGGMSLGVDTDTLVDGMTTGMALSYGRSKVDSKSTSNASTDVDSYVGTLYGSRVFDGGMFVNGQVGLGFNQYDMTRDVAGVGTANGDTDGYQGTVKVEAGQDFAAGGFTLTPLASLQYTYLKMDEYTETGVGTAGLTVDPDALSTIDAGLGGQVAYAIPLTDGGTLKPSVHAKYIHRMGDRELSTTSSFLGATGTSFNTTGVEADRSSVNLGAGLLLTTVGGTDLSLNYDADIRSNLTGHTGQLKARWAF